jgi:hypothetical protein
MLNANESTQHVAVLEFTVCLIPVVSEFLVLAPFSSGMIS